MKRLNLENFNSANAFKPRNYSYILIHCFCGNDLYATVFSDEQYELHCSKCHRIHTGDPSKAQSWNIKEDKCQIQ